MRYTLKIFLLTLAVIGSLILTGCPKRSDIETAAKVGFETTARLRTAQNVVLELYRGGIVSLNAKDLFFDAAAKGWDVFEFYNDKVEETLRKIESGEVTTITAKEIIRKIVSEQVVDVMNRIVTALNLMTPTKAEKLFGIIRTVFAGVTKVLDVLSINSTVLVPIRQT
ncbi:MAG: hypothetical protein ABL984_08725 [Pyrinomonadaceae bacterium]